MRPEWGEAKTKGIVCPAGASTSKGGSMAGVRRSLPILNAI
jgi:hypothetical protein